MKQFFLKTILFLFTVAFYNCENNDPQEQLPPITQTGANTFGAIVDGQVFIPKDKTGYYAPGGGRPRGLSILGGNHSFVLQAKNYEDIYIYIYIPTEIPEEILYTFQNSPGVEYSLNSPNYAHIYSIVNDNKYLSFSSSGSITFTHVNYNEGIYSGVFSVKLKNENDENDIIEILEGRFDFDIGTLNQD